MRLEDFAWLARYSELLANLYAVDIDGVGACHASESDHIPLYVALTLGSYTRRHIFGSARLLALAEIFRSCRDFGNEAK